MTARSALLAVALLLWAAPAVAHEMRPAYLEIREYESGQYEILWKRPARGELVLGLSLRWPKDCHPAAIGSSHAIPGALVERFLLHCGPAGLIGQRIAIDGLSETRSDALIRIAFHDGTIETSLVRPSTPWASIKGPSGVSAIAVDYLMLGFEHILGGIDHLLLLLGLTLIVSSVPLLVKTITAFTLAHSLTLAGATLGLLAVPQAPVEAVIALSILFLASELAGQRQGRGSLTARSPWLVAFVFGLLHGFGFAGALTEVGLPRGDIPLALLAFNLGVEAGQLAFVAAVLAVLHAGRRAIAAAPRWLEPTPAYAVGSLAAFWLIERVAAMG